MDGLRTGNTFAASGQLIDRLAFVACVEHGKDKDEKGGKDEKGSHSGSSAESLAVEAALGNTDVDRGGCATMGEKLEVKAGSDITVAIVVRDPSGTNYSPYSFNNPSLAQVGIQQPLNMPVLDHVDVIRGMVTGYKTPGAPDYSGQWPNDWIVPYMNGLAPSLATVPAAAKNTTAAVIKTFNDSTWATLNRDPEFKVMTFRIPAVRASQYIRLRGTNLPPNVPFETDADGNPLPDLFTNSAAVSQTKAGANDGFPANNFLRIACTVTGTNVPANGVTFTEADGKINGCPNHLPVVNGQKMVAFDVAAWSDLWFYSNPIFIEVKGSTKVAGVE